MQIVDAPETPAGLIYSMSIGSVVRGAAMEEYERSLKTSLRGLLERLPLAGLFPEDRHADAPRFISHRKPATALQVCLDTPSSGPRRFRLPDLRCDAD